MEEELQNDGRLHTVLLTHSLTHAFTHTLTFTHTITFAFNQLPTDTFNHPIANRHLSDDG